MDDLTQPSGIWASVGTALVGVVMGVMWFVKKFATDRADIAGSHAEVDIIGALRDDNARLRELLSQSEARYQEQFIAATQAAAQTTIMQSKIDTLTAQVAALTKQIDDLRSSMEARR